MKVDYRDYLDDYLDGEDYYEENIKQTRPRKFKDTERAKSGNGNSVKKSIRKKRKQKQKQREQISREEEY